VEFGILGPLEVSVAGQPLAIGRARTRAVLALLLVEANRVVPAATLAQLLWPHLTTDRATANLQVRLSELRRALRAVGEGDRLESRPPGYRLRVDEGELDAMRFERLVAAGRKALFSGDAQGSLPPLETALDLWRGVPLADIDGGRLASTERTRLEEVHLDALEARMDALLATGRHQETPGDLEALTGAYPLREHLWYQRLLALYRCGRQAEALRAYQQLRATLVDHLGIEPSPELRELEAQILRQDPALRSRPGGRSEGNQTLGPQTRYVESGGAHIAYQVVGAGATDILFVPGLISHVELAWEDPATAAFYARLAAMGRLILFDKRDTGLSDRSPGDVSLEQRIEDAKAVMDAVDSERAVVFGYSEGAPMAILLAATHPDRVSALILGSAFARWFPAPGYPCGPAAETVYAAMEDIARHRWGQGDTIEWFAPSRARSAEARQALGRLERMSISPSTVVRMLGLIREIDVRAALPAIHVPTLVIHRRGDRINPPFHGRYLADHIAGARYFEQPGDHVLRFAESEELDSMFAQIQGFLVAPTPPPEPNRVLTTILLAEGMSRSSGLAAVQIHGGVLRTHAAESVLATFDAPGRAIRCAVALRDPAPTRGQWLRAGIHTGEVDLVGDQISGPALSTVEAMCRHAQDGEILVSRTVKDLVVGSGIGLTDRSSDLLTSGDYGGFYRVDSQ
jgi:DNA-binding SARP family transcriptional activator/pimeloyl-ACP methyl ester carboxylesterase